jgi:integrase
MGRRVANKNLDTRNARLKLKQQGKPHWMAVGRGLHLGYRKNKPGYSTWVGRRRSPDGGYETWSIALADDVVDANGDTVLSFDQAQEILRTEQPTKRKQVGSYTVKHAIADYLAYLDGKPAAKDVKTRLMLYATPLNDVVVAELTPDQIKQWHRDMSKLPARMRTARNATSHNYYPMDTEEAVRKRQVSANAVLYKLKAALNHAYAEDKTKSADVWRKVKPFKGVSLPRDRYLSHAECQRLLNASAEPFRTLVRAALETGARVSELRRLRVRDLNHESGTLYVRKSKTDTPRHVRLTTEGAAFFRQLTIGKSSDAPLMGYEWGPHDYGHEMRATCKRAKIEGVCFHSLRHTWASLAVMGGVPLMVVARNLGHTDTRQVEKTYGHLAPGYVADAIEAGAPRFGLADSSNVIGLK